MSEQTQKFDPAKSYKWEDDQKITINGNLFGIILNLLTYETQKNEHQIALRKQQAFEGLSKIVQAEVEAGHFTEFEFPTEEQPTSPTPKEEAPAN